MAKPIITILGLGVTGTSLGLALARANTPVEVVGHDKAPEAAQAARKASAVQRVEWNLFAACANASIIVLAMPLREVDETLALIQEDVPPSTLVFVVTDVLQPAAAALAQRLPDHKQAVVGHPILNGIGGALTPRADLFEKVVFAVAAGANTDPGALELVSNFVETIGAQPFYVDPQEHDGIIAGVEQLPQLLSAALIHMLVGAPSWGEVKRLAGRTFAQNTTLDRSAEHLNFALQANRENVLQRLTLFEEELAAWKQLIAASPEPEAAAALQTALTQSVAAREGWEAQAILQEWEPKPLPMADAQTPGFFRQLFLGNLGSKKRDPDTKS